MLEKTQPSIIYPEDLSAILKIMPSENVVIVDCCYNEYEFFRGHLPNAIPRIGNMYVKTGDQCDLGLYYPSTNEFSEMLREMGIGHDTLVIAYDGGRCLYATRFLWGLLLYGHTNIRLLNGGWQYWVSQNMPVSTSIYSMKPLEQKPNLSFNSKFVISKDELIMKLSEENVKIIDVRSMEEYLGLDSRGNKRCGRIPGAINIEWTQFLTCEGSSGEVCLIKSKEEIMNMLTAFDIRPEHSIITYCQRGIRASLVAYVLYAYGYESVRLYDGSMIEWANDDQTPLL